MSQSVSWRYVLNQGPVLRCLAGIAVRAPFKRFVRDKSVSTPGDWITRVVPPRPRGMVNAYMDWIGDGPARHDEALPPHLFPQWGLPLLARALRDLPYPLTGILNRGCRMRRAGRLPADQSLHLRARLESADSESGRLRLHQRLLTGTEASPDILLCDVYGTIRLKRGGGGSRERPVVPGDTVVAGRRDLPERAGLDYARLTGDFNPIHWLRPAARAAGFRRPILHGFATLALAADMLERWLAGEGLGAWSEIDVRFVRPLVLPAAGTLHVSLEAGRESGTLWFTGADDAVCMAGTFRGEA